MENIINLYEASQAQLTKAHADFDQLAAKAIATEAEANAARAEAERLQAVAEADASKAKTEVERLKAIVEAGGELSELRGQVIALALERDELRGQVGKLTAEKTDFDGKVRAKLVEFGIRSEGAIKLPKFDEKKETLTDRVLRMRAETGQ